MKIFFIYVFPCPVNIHIVSTAQTNISLKYRTFSMNKKLPAFSEITQVYHHLKILLQVTNHSSVTILIILFMALIERNFHVSNLRYLALTPPKKILQIILSDEHTHMHT